MLDRNSDLDYHLNLINRSLVHGSPSIKSVNIFLRNPANKPINENKQNGNSSTAIVKGREKNDRNNEEKALICEYIHQKDIKGRKMDSTEKGTIHTRTPWHAFHKHEKKQAQCVNRQFWL